MQFAQVVGQIRLKNSLIDAVREKRVPHAQLFSGAQGSGTFALALAYAQFISCTNRRYYENTGENELHGDSCGKCPSCLKYSKLSHPDLHFIFPNTTTKKVDKNNESALFMEDFRAFALEKDGYIDINSWLEYLKVDNKQGEINVRDAASIVRELTMTTYESPYKIMIIWNADRLRHDVAPKLLKILEEPYDGTIFLLITENTEAILPTILSRTQLVKVLPTDETDIERFLIEKKQFEPEKAAITAANAEGDVIKALQYEAETKKEYTSFFIQWTRAAFQYRSKASEISILVEQIAKTGRESQKDFFSHASKLFGECLMCSMGVPIKASCFGNENIEFRNKFSKFVNSNNITAIFKLLEQARYHISRNANSKILFFDLSLQIGIQLNRK